MNLRRMIAARWLDWLVLALILAGVLLLGLMVAFGQSAPVLAIAPVKGTANLRVTWTAMTNPLVADYLITVGTGSTPSQTYTLAGRTNTSLVISNLATPGNYTLTAQTRSAAGALSAPSAETNWNFAVRLMQITGCPSNYVVQASSNLKGWISISNLTVTNNGAQCFYRATTNWP